MLLAYLGCTSAALPQDPNDDEETTYDAGTTTEVDTGLTIVVTPPVVDAGTDAASGCADGTREGFPDQANVATCAGTWTGDVANGVALCAPGWHVCDGSEPSFKVLTYDQAVAVVGCFAVNASDDHGDCHHGCAKAVADGVDDALNVDMAGVGSLCPFHDKDDDSCLKKGRIDFTQNSGTGCNFAIGLNGVTCCTGL